MVAVGVEQPKGVSLLGCFDQHKASRPLHYYDFILEIVFAVVLGLAQRQLHRLQM